MGRRIAAAEALAQSRVLEALAPYSPTVVSTIWVGLDLPESDINMVCCFKCRSQFERRLIETLGGLKDFTLSSSKEALIARATLGAFPLEIYGSNVAISEQVAFRHYQVMQRLTFLSSADFSNRVRAYKTEGLKTEPAIAAVLNLQGEPFAAVMALECASEAKLVSILRNAGCLRLATEAVAD